MTDEPLEHASSRLPIVTSTDGHPYLGVDAVVELNLACRGIEHAR